MRLLRVLAAIGLIAVAPLPALAAPQDAVMNKEGYWGIDVDNGACAASMTLQGGAVFLLRAQEGQVTFGLFAQKPLPRGKAGRIETEAYGFDFKPSYSEEATTLYYEDNLDARALAALRLAKQARILIDGRVVTAMTLEGTGFEGALDGVIACSNGERGWWGQGVGATAEAKGSGAALPVNKEGLWSLRADGEGCVSALVIEGGLGFVLIAANGGRDILVGAGSDAGFKRGRKGVFETDTYSFAFKPEFSGDTYVQLDRFLDSQAVFALRRAKTMGITIDGKPVVDAVVTDTGLPQLLTDLAACAAGQTGWWGEGAKAR